MNKTDRERIKQQSMAKKLEKANEEGSKALAEAEKPKPASKPKKPKINPKDDPRKVQHRCGHFTGLAHYEQQDCAECRNISRQKRNQRHREKRSTGPDQLIPQRLPDGSIYHKVYDAEKKEWTVQLCIPQTSETALVFSAIASGSIKAEHEADRQYRKHLAKTLKVEISNHPLDARGERAVESVQQDRAS